MRSAGRRWRCKGCGRQVGKAYTRHNKQYLEREQRKQLVAELLSQGLTMQAVARLAHCRDLTVRGIAGPGYQAKACKCGRSMSHSGTCPERGREKIRRQAMQITASQSLEREIESRIANSLPANLPRTIRDEVMQDMLFAISAFVDETVKRAAQYVRDYYKRANAVGTRQHLSLDTDFTYLADHLAG